MEEYTTGEIVAICIVVGLILLMPVIYNLFGAEYKKEGECGTETLWQKLINKFKK